MSFFGALGAGLQGWEQGRQQKQDRQAAQQDLLQRQADAAQNQAIRAQQLAQEKTTFDQSQEDRQRNHGVDPATGKPFVLPQPLTQVLPNNKGKGQPTLQDYYNHYTSLARYYTQTGQTDQANLAAGMAQSAQQELQKAQTQAALDARDEYNQTHQDQRTAAIISGALQRTGMNNQTAIQDTNSRDATSQGNAQLGAGTRLLTSQLGQLGQNQRSQAQIDAVNGRHATDVQQRYLGQASANFRSVQHQRQSAINSGAADPFPDLDKFNTGLSSLITQVSKNPGTLKQALNAVDTGDFEPQLKDYAHQLLQKLAGDAKPPPQQPAGGGSNASGDPTSPWR